MEKYEPTRDELIEKIRALEERLLEAEQTIEAIQSGEVDALVIQKPDGEKLYTLTGADYGYRVLVESITEGALILSSDDSIYYCNHTLGEMLGLPIQKIIGTKLDPYVVFSEGRAQLMELINEIRDLGVAKGEFLIKRNDGTLLPVNVSLNRMSVSDFEGVCAVITDLTEQKRVEEELRRHRTELEMLVNEATADLQQEIIERKHAEEEVRGQREWLRVTLTSIGDALIATDAAGRITFLNSVAAKLTGWREDEARGKLIQEVFTIINEKTRKPAEDVVRRVLRDGRSALLANHTSLVTRDGREIPIEDSAAPIKDRTGNLIGVVLVFHDVTDRRRSQDETQRLHAAIRQERDTLSALVSSMADEVWFADAQKKFTLANPSALLEFALDSDSDMDIERFSASLEVFRPDGSPRPVEEAPPLRSLKGEVLRNLEETVRVPASGELRHRLVNSSPVKSADGNIIGAVSVVRDITGRKHMEEELRKSRDELELRVQERTAELSTTVARLELVNAELQEFAFVASHDLQEPLRKIQTFCDMAQKRCAPVLDGTSKDYLDRVIKSASRMRQLLSDLLDFSKVATRLEAFKKIDLVKTVREAADVFEASVKETGCQIEIENIPAIEADEIQMLGLFQNLIGNALKFRSSETPRIKIYGKLDRKRTCEIFVNDNGIGFDPKFAERIFKPFQRLHGRSEYDGTGMGLAICRKIVERHGGSIRAESEPGKGSTFIIRLPVKQDRL
ncbi:MAG: PAS domain S-box protein [Syntrophobacteraceae bacterium]|jgi:PAS domain S-box-containing protein